MAELTLLELCAQECRDAGVAESVAARMSFLPSALRQRLVAEAAALPPGARTPDSLLFGEGFDPTDTYILALMDARALNAQDIRDSLKQRPHYRWDKDLYMWVCQTSGFYPRVLYPKSSLFPE